MPVGVMYQLAELEAGASAATGRPGLDPDRLEAHDERETAGEEQSRERGDERLHVEVLDEDADEQADRRAGEDHDRDDDHGGDTPAPSSLAHRMPVNAITEPTERSMPPVTMTNVMPDREDQQVGVVEQQRRHVPRA